MKNIKDSKIDIYSSFSGHITYYLLGASVLRSKVSPGLLARGPSPVMNAFLDLDRQATELYLIRDKIMMKHFYE